jgi:hypothetical protein
VTHSIGCSGGAAAAVRAAGARDAQRPRTSSGVVARTHTAATGYRRRKNTSSYWYDLCGSTKFCLPSNSAARLLKSLRHREERESTDVWGRRRREGQGWAAHGKKAGPPVPGSVDWTIACAHERSPTRHLPAPLSHVAMPALQPHLPAPLSLLLCVCMRGS